MITRLFQGGIDGVASFIPAKDKDKEATLEGTRSRSSISIMIKNDQADPGISAHDNVRQSVTIYVSDGHRLRIECLS